MKILHAVYDLAVGEVTFDFTYWLVQAEVFRKTEGYDHLHVLIVPGPHDGFRMMCPRDRQFDVHYKTWRLHNLFLPATRLVGATVSIWPDRNISGVGFPKGWTPDNPCGDRTHDAILKLSREHDVQVLRAPEDCLHRVQGEGFITITLRESEYRTARNSDVNAWLEIARWLAHMGHDVRIIPDTDAWLAGKGFRGNANFSPQVGAAMNVPIRVAMYEKAKLNLGVASGMHPLWWLNRNIKFIMVKYLVPESPTNTESYLKQHGLLPRPDYLRPWQQFHLEGDDPAFIKKEIEAFLTS